MLPPESIRFFRLDESWIRALLDGAFSLGRNLTATASGASANLDRALLDPVAAQARAAAPVRPRAGAAAPDPSGGTAWTGFLLRSRVVSDYPGLGVNAYTRGHTPSDPEPVLMPVRRLDRLSPGNGPASGGDTLLCLLEGDAYRVDIHEAPELLHYGIDDYRAAHRERRAHGGQERAHVHGRAGRRDHLDQGQARRGHRRPRRHRAELPHPVAPGAAAGPRSPRRSRRPAGSAASMPPRWGSR